MEALVTARRPFCTEVRPAMRESPGDAEFVGRFRAGEARAFEMLVERYKRPLYALLVRVVRDRDAAEDLLQECFVRLWRHLDELDETRPLYGYLRRVAVNLGLNHLRGRRRRRAAVEASLRERPPVFTDPGQDDELAETSAAVREALEELPEEQRACLILRAQEGMSYAEIARAAGVAVGTVMSRLSRARLALRRKLKERAVL